MMEKHNKILARASEEALKRLLSEEEFKTPAERGACALQLWGAQYLASTLGQEINVEALKERGEVVLSSNEARSVGLKWGIFAPKDAQRFAALAQRAAEAAARLPGGDIKSTLERGEVKVYKLTSPAQMAALLVNRKVAAIMLKDRASFGGWLGVTWALFSPGYFEERFIKLLEKHGHVKVAVLEASENIKPDKEAVAFAGTIKALVRELVLTYTVYASAGLRVLHYEDSFLGCSVEAALAKSEGAGAFVKDSRGSFTAPVILSDHAVYKGTAFPWANVVLAHTAVSGEALLPHPNVSSGAGSFCFGSHEVGAQALHIFKQGNYDSPFSTAWVQNGLEVLRALTDELAREYGLLK